MTPRQRHAYRLRHARNILRHFARRYAAATTAARRQAVRARYERACALLVTQRLNNDAPRPSTRPPLARP